MEASHNSFLNADYGHYLKMRQNEIAFIKFGIDFAISNLADRGE
jgi:hypothetical protein